MKRSRLSKVFSAGQRRACVTAVLLSTAAASAADPRTFTDIEGRAIVAEPVAVEGDVALIRKQSDGRIYRVPLAQLSEKDREFFANWEAPAQPAPLKATCVQKSTGAGNARNRYYEITLENRRTTPLTGLTCAYRLIIERNDRYAEERFQRATEDGEVPVPEIPARGKVTIKTAPVLLTRGNEADLQGSITILRKWNDSLAGINLSLRRGKTEVFADSVGAFKDRGVPAPRVEPEAPEPPDPPDPQP
ncbi:MAG TPA: hypothetical protein VMN36_07140 [Verrucomicrobiales bacterium]|nr:hypothetical protein [Verrucomicrobiales bacterium]